MSVRFAYAEDALLDVAPDWSGKGKPNHATTWVAVDGIAAYEVRERRARNGRVRFDGWLADDEGQRALRHSLRTGKPVWVRIRPDGEDGMQDHYCVVVRARDIRARIDDPEDVLTPVRYEMEIIGHGRSEAA